MEEPMNVVCFGDSITAESGFAEGDRWPSILQFKLNQWRPGAYKVYNRGIGGNTTAMGFDRLESEIIPLLPALVLIEFGLNDANVRDGLAKNRVGLEEFKANLRAMHRTVIDGGGKAVFVVNHTVTGGPGQGNGKSYVENFAPYNEAIREMAAELSVPAIDLPQIMKEMKVDLEAFLAPHDHLHITAAGNHIYADMVFESLQNIMNTR